MGEPKTFAEIIDFHLSRGIRPDGENASGKGPWTNQTFAAAVNAGERTVRNWRAGQTVPDDMWSVEQAFFGDSVNYATEREELRLAFEAARKRAGPKPPHISPRPLPPPGTRPANLPYGTMGDMFKGRDEFLAELEETLGGANAPQPGTPAVAAAIIDRAVVHGLGGIGKTRAAVEFALSHRDKYSALLYLPASSAQDVHNNLAALAAPAILNLDESDSLDMQVRLAAVQRWLAANPLWFLLIDNADNDDAAAAVEALIGNLSGGQIIVTSRNAHWSAQVKCLPLDLLSEADAIGLLEAATPRRLKADDDGERVKELAEALGHLCLALVQAGAYINQRRMSFADYLAQWEKNRGALLDWFNERTMQYPASVAVTWVTTFEQLSEEARRLLYALAFYSVEPIPVSLLNVEPGEDGENIDWLGALAELEQYSLITRDDDQPEFSVHRLVQQVTRDRLKPDEVIASLATALGWLADATLETDAQDVRSWPVLDPLLPHTLAAMSAASDDAAALSQSLTRLLNEFGILFDERAQYDHAEPLFRRGLSIAEAIYRPDHPEIAACLSNLAGLLQETNRLEEAEPLFRRGLSIVEAIYRPDHPSVAKALNNLAGLLHAINRYGEAELLYRGALSIAEAIYRPDHPEVARGLNNLAGLLVVTNRSGEAEPLLRRALSIAETIYRPDHPSVATGLNSFASLLLATNRPGEAEPFYRRALSINEASYGRDHPNVARSLNNLAELLRATNSHGEAEPLYRRALSILLKFTAATGHRHPHLNLVVDNYAVALQRLGKDPPETAAEIAQLFHNAGLRPEDWIGQNSDDATGA